VPLAIDLRGKRGLVVGIANEHSIAYGCARALRDAGAGLAVTYLNSKAEPPSHQLVTIEEIGALSAFLASDAAMGQTGSVSYVDGGFPVVG
jgi:enoyl-[acyl-carrier-protein] reductase (NADH)